MALGWRKEYARYKSFFLNIVNLYKQKRDLRMFLEILLSLVTVSFFALFALRPTLLTISQLLKDIKTKEGAVAKMETKIANLETAQFILDQQGNKLTVINSAVFDIPKPEIFARQIDGLGNKNSVSILGLSLEEVTLIGKSSPAKSSKESKPLPAGAYEMNFSLNVGGDYAQLYSFLRDLENLRIPLGIDSLTINSSKVEEQKLLTLAVSGRIPYLGTSEKK